MRLKRSNARAQYHQSEKHSAYPDSGEDAVQTDSYCIHKLVIINELVVLKKIIDGSTRHRYRMILQLYVMITLQIRTISAQHANQ